LPSTSTATNPCCPNDANTNSPSVTGVAEAWLFFWWMCSRLVNGIGVSHNGSPLPRS